MYKLSRQMSQEMLVMRMTQLKTATVDLLRNIAERAGEDKSKMVFMINNLDYICNEFATLQMDKFDDLVALTKDHNVWAARYIQALIQNEFSGLLELVNKFAKDDGSDSGLRLAAEADLKVVNKDRLETISNDIADTWNHKVTTIQQSINTHISSKASARQLFWTLLKQLMVKYSAFCEIVRIGHPAFFQQLTAQHVLLDLKNLSISLMQSASSL
jgi:hypothetical protein